MIDSSGRRALKANGTVLDLLPIGQAIGISGVLLIILFTLVRPEASMGLGTAGRLLFWTLHVGLGLVSLWVASQWLANGQRLPQATLLRVLLTGVAGILIAAPGYIALDFVFAPYQVEQSPDAETNLTIMALPNEILEISPWFMASWLLINLPVLLPRPSLQLPMDDTVSYMPAEPKQINSSDENAIFSGKSDVSGADKQDKSTTRENKTNQSVQDNVQIAPTPEPAIAQRFLSTLPGVIGKDVVAVSSDLHYLNVWTQAGRTTVLGNLRDVIDELDTIGMQVHRSHWIAYAHVRRIVGTANNGACILSNQLRIPISRRRWKAVREQFGRGVVVTTNNIVSDKLT